MSVSRHIIAGDRKVCIDLMPATRTVRRRLSAVGGGLCA